jgi:hypothetical protein
VNLAEKLKRLERKHSQDMVSLPRVQSKLDAGKHPPLNRGADKMHPKGMNYSEAYAEFLEGVEPKRFVELGVFTGVSMAVWLDVYPQAEVVGLDVDLNRVNHDLFKKRKPALFKWDAFAPEPLSLLNDIDVFIDDGPHVTEAVVRVAEFMAPRMKAGGRFIVEDMRNGGDILRAVFPGLPVIQHGQIACAFL